jgi:hypothetical protein
VLGRFRNAAGLAFFLVLSGCVSAVTPLLEPRDSVTDDRIVGTYKFKMGTDDWEIEVFKRDSQYIAVRNSKIFFTFRVFARARGFLMETKGIDTADKREPSPPITYFMAMPDGRDWQIRVMTCRGKWSWACFAKNKQDLLRILNEAPAEDPPNTVTAKRISG